MYAPSDMRLPSDDVRDLSSLPVQHTLFVRVMCDGYTTASGTFLHAFVKGVFRLTSRGGGGDLNCFFNSGSKFKSEIFGNI
jgi:hypothetical protein